MPRHGWDPVMNIRNVNTHPLHSWQPWEIDLSTHPPRLVFTSTRRKGTFLFLVDVLALQRRIPRNSRKRRAHRLSSTARTDSFRSSRLSDRISMKAISPEGYHALWTAVWRRGFGLHKDRHFHRECNLWLTASASRTETILHARYIPSPGLARF